MINFIPTMKSAIGRLEVRLANTIVSRGTCFLISDRQVITAAHVIMEAGENEIHVSQKTISIQFPAITIGAVLLPVSFNQKQDWAILTLDESVDIIPLQLCSSVPFGKEWLTYGFPDYSPTDGVICEGTISDPIATIKDCWAIQLHCREAANNAPIRGLSGGPCIVGKKVIGVIRSAIIDARSDLPVSGVLYATPIESIAITSGIKLPPVSYTHDSVVSTYLEAVNIISQKQTYLSIYNAKHGRDNDEIYVSLRAKEVGNKKELVKKDFNHKIEAKDSFSASEVTPSEMIAASRDGHIFILGEAGAGKSTLLRHIAGLAWNAPQKVGLQVRHIPVTVRLAALAEVGGSLHEKISAAVYEDMPLAGPPNLLEHLVNETGMPFLFLFDAFDEVPQRLQTKLLLWMDNLFSFSDSSKMIITTRPTAARNVDFAKWKCSQYEILPFSPEQTVEFAEKWFGDQKDIFLVKFKQLCPREMHGTPLLLTISAKVFSSFGDLPQNRTLLYKIFVDTWLEEAVLHDLQKDFENIQLERYAHLILSDIAFDATNANDILDAREWERIATNAIYKFCNVNPHAAEIDSKMFLQVMGRRSGVFNDSGSNYEFVHPTFREFLAAESLVRTNKSSPANVLDFLLNTDNFEKWSEVTLFAVALLSQTGVDLTNQINHFLTCTCNDILALVEKGEDADYDDIYDSYYKVWLVYQMICEGAFVKPEVILNLIQTVDYYIQLAHDIGSFADDCEGPYSPMEILGTYINYDQARSVVSKYFHNDTSDGHYLRFFSAQCLICSGYKSDELVEVLKWAFGEHSFYNLDYVSDVRTDLADMFGDHNFVGLRQKIYLKLLHDLVDYNSEDEDIFPCLLDALSYEFTDDKAEDLKNMNKLLLHNQNMVDVTSQIKLNEYFDLDFEKIILSILNRRRLIITDTIIYVLNRVKLNSMQQVKTSLISFCSDRDFDDWQRVHYALYLLDYFNYDTAIKRILSTEGDRSYDPCDGYAFDFAKKQYLQRQG